MTCLRAVTLLPQERTPEDIHLMLDEMNQSLFCLTEERAQNMGNDISVDAKKVHNKESMCTNMTENAIDVRNLCLMYT